MTSAPYTLQTNQLCRIACVALLTIAALLGCVSNDEPIARQSNTATEFHTLMTHLYEQGQFNGAVVIANNGNIIYEGGWGFANAEEGVAFTPDTTVDGASLAKNFVAASLWMLVAEGNVDLDAAVQTYLPEFSHTNTTVRHLLEHSAGLPEFEETSGRSNTELVAAMRSTPNFRPGSRFSYCNECFDTLALLIERVTGESWIDFLQRRIFIPLGMDSVFLRPALFADWENVRTISYRTINGSLVPYDIWDNEAFYGSSNLYFSARDLSRWAHAWADKSVLPMMVLNAAMSVPRFTNGETSALNRSNWYYHQEGSAYYFNGHLRGFHHTVYWEPMTNLSIVWVTNVLEPRPNPQLLTRALIQIAHGNTARTVDTLWFERPEKQSDQSAIHGSYDVPGLGIITVTSSEYGPLFKINNGAEHDGYPSEAFYAPDFDAEIGFSELQDEQYQRIHWLTVFENLSGTRITSR